MEEDFRSFKETLKATINRLKELENSENGMTGISTGFCDLDYAIKGLNKSNLIVIASRPAMGKTALALNIATHVATKENIPVAIFSLEMLSEQLTSRILCSEAMVDSNKVRKAKLDNVDWKKIMRTSEQLSKFEIYINDIPGISINEIKEKCIKLKQDKDIGLVVIDYLQLIQGSNKNYNSREQEISAISLSLKNLAQELNIPIIVLSSVSRTADTRFYKGEDPRPILEDIKYSGTIVQDADIIMFLYRDDYYNLDSEKKGIAEVIIAKNRYGTNGTVELIFIDKWLKFANLDRKGY